MRRASLTAIGLALLVAACSPAAGPASTVASSAHPGTGDVGDPCFVAPNATIDYYPAWGRFDQMNAWVEIDAADLLATIDVAQTNDDDELIVSLPEDRAVVWEVRPNTTGDATIKQFWADRIGSTLTGDILVGLSGRDRTQRIIFLVSANVDGSVTVDRRCPEAGPSPDRVVNDYLVDSPDRYAAVRAILEDHTMADRLRTFLDE